MKREVVKRSGLRVRLESLHFFQCGCANLHTLCMNWYVSGRGLVFQYFSLSRPPPQIPSLTIVICGLLHYRKLDRETLKKPIN
jgi:hypothetical protein